MRSILKPKFHLSFQLHCHFVHYHSFEEAVNAFKRRITRISYENLFVIFSERDGCTYEDLKIFDNLPYNNKVVFTHKPYADIKSAYYIEGFEGSGKLGNIMAWDKKTGIRYMINLILYIGLNQT